MHIRSVSSNNESVVVHCEEKWCKIVALDIGWRFTFSSGF